MKHVAFYLIAIAAIAFLLYLNFSGGKNQSAPAPVIATGKAPQPIGPYSQAVAKGNALFVSGQIALDAAGALDTSSIQNETRRVMENIKAILEAGQMQVSDIAQATIYLTDLGDFKSVNEVYGGYFGKGPFPARATVQVAALPKGAHVEISVVAVR